MLIKMLSRPLSRPDLHQLIRYINEEREGFQHEPHFMFRYNTVGENAKDVAQDFSRNNEFIKQRKGRQNGVIHIVMSWHPKEKLLLDNSKLFAFGEKFAELMNFDNAVVFGRPHYEKDNIHLHFAVSASELGNGKSRRISKSKLKNIQLEMNLFQQRDYPELKHSLVYLPEHKKSRESSLGIPMPEKLREVDGSIRAQKRGQASIVQELREEVLAIAKQNPRKNDFIRSLNLSDKFQVYYYRDKPNGIQITETGKKFRFRRLAIDLDELQRNVRLNEIEKIHRQRSQEKDQERDRGRELER